MIAGAVEIPAWRSAYEEETQTESRDIPIETPVAIEINGVAYAVMMATPCDLEDFVVGFLLAEGLAASEEIGGVSLHQVNGGDGLVARVNLPSERLAPIMERARRRLGDSSCGICGIESVEAALRPLPRIAASAAIRPRAIRTTLLGMRDAQELGALTYATHAAAFADQTGKIIALREDVGRHNALDKLVGCLARSGTEAASGFILVTSRCSYELVEKAARAGCPLLVAISAPTDLAVRRAQAAGLALAVTAREDSLLWITGPQLEVSDGL